MVPIAASLLIEQLQAFKKDKIPFQNEKVNEMRSLVRVIKETLKDDEKKNFSKNWKELKAHVHSKEPDKIVNSVNKIIKLIKPLQNISQTSFCSICYSLGETFALLYETFGTVKDALQDSYEVEKNS